MSSARPNDGPSPAPDAGADPASGFSLASLVRLRGASLLDGLETHLPGSREHAEATASYAFAAAVELGHDRSRCELVREAAKLHEVGKVYVPRSVLAKASGELDEDERAQLDRQHEAAHGLARGAGVPEQVCDWLLRVRERYDGAGPDGLAGERIPIESRIVRAACACDLLLASPETGRAKAAHPRGATVDELRRTAGAELDPRVVEALVTVVERAIAVDRPRAG